MAKIYLPFIMLLILIACSQGTRENNVSYKKNIPIVASVTPAIDSTFNGTIEIKTFTASEGTFGYDLIVNGAIFIHQPSIPGLAGNRGFTSAERARIVGEFVGEKIRNSKLPPVVTFLELDSLGVLN